MMPYEPLTPSRDASPELVALYKHSNERFEELVEHNESQDRDISALRSEVQLELHATRDKMDSVLITVGADRREREASLTVVVGAAIRQVLEETRSTYDERFARQEAEASAALASIVRRLDEHDRRFDLTHAEVAQCPTREELNAAITLADKNCHNLDVALDKAVARVETEIDSEIRGENGIEPRVHELETGRRTRAFAWKLALGGALAGAVATSAFPPVIELIKQLRGKVHL
jgi:hypothetical protein